MAKVTDDAIEIGIPFALPFLGINEPTTLSINKTYLQLLVRIIVTVCTGFLFWPRIKTAFGFSSNAVTEAQTQEIQDRIAKLEHERDQRQSQKSYAVATASGAAPNTPAATAAAKDKGSAKRRKA